MKTLTLSLTFLIFVIFKSYGQEEKSSPCAGQKEKTTYEDIVSIEKLIHENVKGQFGIDVEQDFFVDCMHNKNFDRNYTQGTGFFYTKSGLDKSILFTPFNIIEWVNKLNGKNTNLMSYPSTIGIGVTAFTPRILDSPTPIEGDRPFAGLMYLSTTKNRFNIKSNAFIQTSFNYGILGTNITNTFQSWIHTTPLSDRPSDISWDHQISRGGSFAFLFSHKVSKSILSLPKIKDKKKWLDASIGYKMNLGWYTGMSVLTNIKIGLMHPLSINSTDYDVSLGIGNKNIGQKELDLEKQQDSMAKMDSTTKEYRKWEKKAKTKEDDIKLFKQCKTYKTWDIFVFGSFNPRVTAYNSLILGQPHVESIYTLNYEDYNPFILDIEYGLVVSRLKVMTTIPVPLSRLDIIVSFNHRSPEIRNDEYKRWHHWGRVSVRFPLF